MSTYVLYNPFAGNSTCEASSTKLNEILSGEELIFRNMVDIADYRSFFDGLQAEDKVILCGGDGTLNRFVNAVADVDITNEILYYGTGSGNDFLHDLDKKKGAEPFPINDIISELPEVTINGKTSRFINAIGFGIDGYCCEVGDEVRKKSNGKPVNYTPIAIKGVLGGYKPVNAVILVDGEERHYRKVWLAPSMHGRYYGGGMQAAPTQNRSDPEGRLSLVVWHDSSWLKTLLVFPSIFKGKHVSHTECLDIISAHEVTVRFDRPCALQIDGETVLGVTEYSAKSKAKVKQDKAAKEAATV